jgi:hypothetical protein
MLSRSRLTSAIVLFCLASTAAAQVDLEGPAATTWKELMAAEELNDSREIEKIVRKNRDMVAEIFLYVEAALAYDDSLDVWDQGKKVAGWLDRDADNNEFATKLEIIEKIPLEKRPERQALKNDYAALRPQLQAAWKNRENEKVNELIPQMSELAQKFQDFGDAVYQSWCLIEVAKVLEESGQKVEAANLYLRCDEALKAAGFQRLKLQVDVVTVLDRLREAGAVPGEAGKGKGDGGPVTNSASSWAKDEAGQRWSDPIPLKLVVDEKLPWSKLSTPAYCNSENTSQWQTFVLQGNGPAVLDERFRPLGLELKVKREGVKIQLDEDGDGKFRDVKAIAKPDVVEVEREFVDPWTKEKVKQKYAFLLATGGDEEQRFGLVLNASPGANYYHLRFAPASYLRGNVLGLDVKMIDDNVTGKFGDELNLTLATNLKRPQIPFTDAMAIGNSNFAQPFSEFLEVGGEFYRLRMSTPDEAYSVKVRKLAVDTGFVQLDFKNRIKPEAVVIAATGEFKGAYFNIAAGKPVRVPVDRYKVVYGIIRSGKKDQQLSCLIAATDDMTSLEVKKDETAKFEMGAPYSFIFDTENLGNGDIKVKGLSVAVKGRGGEMYTHFFDEPPIPESVQLVVDGKATGKALPMKKATVEDWRTDATSVWGPLDLTLTGAKSSAYSIAMKLKKHKLLDGPIETKPN